jgi:hypothetical protein
MNLGPRPISDEYFKVFKLEPVFYAKPFFYRVFPLDV